PGAPPWYRTPQPVVHPLMGGEIEHAVNQIGRTFTQRLRRKLRIPGHSDPAWAYELANVINVLSERLMELEETVKSLHRAPDSVVSGMYDGNEVYVVARS